jgi:hypothetical protein
MNLKASIAASVLGLVAGVGCSAAPSSPKPAAGVVETSTTTAAVKAVSFASCTEAKAAGYHDMHKGQPGYSSKLDADGDGVACVS